MLIFENCFVIDHLTVLLLGITSGIDINEWNPSADECIYAYYASHDLSGKVVKSYIQSFLN